MRQDIKPVKWWGNITETKLSTKQQMNRKGLNRYVTVQSLEERNESCTVMCQLLTACQLSGDCVRSVPSLYHSHYSSALKTEAKTSSETTVPPHQNSQCNLARRIWCEHTPRVGHQKLYQQSIRNNLDITERGHMLERWGSVTGRVRYSSMHGFQTGTEAHFTSYPMGTSGCLPEGKEAKTFSWPSTFI